MMLVPGRAHEKTTNQNQTVLGYHEDRAGVLSPASVNPKMQRVPGALLGTVFRAVSFSADPPFAQESEPLHPLI